MPSISRYFIGQRVESSQLEPSQAKDFATFVDHHLNAPIRLNLSQSDYRSLPKSEQSNVKRVGYFTPGAFREPIRQQYLVDHCNLLCLDIDTTPDGAAPAAPFLADPDLLAAHLAPFSFAAYQTASSTPSLPRIRVVVDAEGIPPGLYGAAVQTIARRIHLPEVTTESLLPHQPMFCPTIFSDSTDHPVFISSLSGRAFLPTDIGEDPLLPTSRRPSTGTPVTSDPLDDLNFLRAPMEGFPPDMARSALECISPDCGYFPWLDIGFALHHQFGDAGYEIFDTWSSRSHKYAGPEDTQDKWRSFAQHPSGRSPITIRTLIKRATATGKWTMAEEVKALTFEQVEGWLLGVQDEAEFQGQAALRIAALPLASNMQTSRLIKMVVDAGKRFELKIKEEAVTKDVKKARALLNPPKKLTKEDDWPKEFRGLCYITNRRQFYHVIKQEPYSPESLDIAFGRFLLPTEEQIAQSETPLDPSKPTMRPRDFVANRLKCTVAHDFTYDPSMPNTTYIEEDGHVFVNQYNASGYPRPTEEGSEEAGEAIMQHLYVLIKEAHYRRHVMDWLAFIVQHPGVKIRHALAIQGVKGCGKTVLANLLSTLLGPKHLSVVDNDTISRGWSEWACGAQVVAIEEIKVSGHNRHEIMNRLKPFISNDVIPINERGTATRTTRNRTNYILFTNHHDALVVTPDERRYFVIESRMQTLEQKMEWIKEGYFNKLFDVIQNQGSALRYFFEHWQISDSFDPNADAPRTTYLDALVADCANEETAAIRRVIEDGDDPLVRPDLVGVTTLQRRLETESLRLSQHRIARILRDEAFVKVDTKVQVDGVRQTFYRKAGMLNGSTDIAAVVKQRAAEPIEGMFE